MQKADELDGPKFIPIAELARLWIEFWEWDENQDHEAASNNDNFAFDEFLWLTTQHPERAWEAILAVVHHPAVTKKALGQLAAGPIEDLLGGFGAQFIDRIEAEAKSNPVFAHTLGGVWQFTTPDDIWARVEAVMDETGWNEPIDQESKPSSPQSK